MTSLWWETNKYKDFSTIVSNYFQSWVRAVMKLSRLKEITQITNSKLCLKQQVSIAFVLSLCWITLSVPNHMGAIFLWISFFVWDILLILQLLCTWWNWGHFQVITPHTCCTMFYNIESPYNITMKIYILK